MTKREQKFIKMYANLPLGTRNEICAVAFGVPYTFKDLYKLSLNENYASELIFKEALEKMERLDILPKT